MINSTRRRKERKSNYFCIISICVAIILGITVASITNDKRILLFNNKAENFMEYETIGYDFNNFPVSNNVIKKSYGKSGLGRELYYYRIGEGKRSLIINFAIHGYEDGWDKDGYDLFKMAKTIISKFSKNYNDLEVSDWSIYIIPCSNPDGLLDGYTNNGPGRCQITEKIDLNRNFPSKFENHENHRNFNGDKPLSVPESKKLSDLILDIKDKSKDFVLLDVHGWLNETIGDYEIGKYFHEEFDFKNKPLTEEFKGYLVGYAKSLGGKVSLVELPKPSNPEEIVTNDYEGKLYRGIINLLKEFK